MKAALEIFYQSFFFNQSVKLEKVVALLGLLLPNTFLKIVQFLEALRIL